MQSYQEQLSANLFIDTSAFELTHEPDTQSLMVFVNGVFQRLYFDYNIASTDLLFTSLIPSGYDVRATYQYNQPMLCGDGISYENIQETLSPTISTQTVYTLQDTPVNNSYLIYRNGVLQRDTIDYNINSNSVEFSTPLAINDVVSISYKTIREINRVVPEGIRGSTTLSPVVTSYELLAERIKMQIGWPMTNIELCDDQIYDFINQSCEWFSKYSGFTEEYLIFDSKIYQCGYGLKIDHIFNNIADFYCPYSAAGAMVSGQYIDCDTNNYRKVAGIFSVDPAGGQGRSSEILFNMDYLFAQQAYFGQMLGGVGYDITTWHLLKEWMDLRKKVFATDVYVNFNPQQQLLKLTPEPHIRAGRPSGYIGIIGCRMEKSVRELVQERWVQKYTLALTKIALAHIRGKFGGVTLFGGGQVNATDLMVQGLDEKNKLEEEILTYGAEQEPPMFFCA